jgi:hypothetical protein
MRMRADQVREGHRLRGARVTRVRSSLDAGVVRISVDNAEEAGDTAMATGTFCYRADDVLDVDVAPRTGAGPRRTRSKGRSRRDDSAARAYRVEYQAPAGDGYLIVLDDSSTTPSLVVRAHELLRTQGIDARIRRIVPVEQGATSPAHARGVAAGLQ